MSFCQDDYRPNPKRALFVQGEINQAMVGRLTPEILRFRSESNAAVTVYVDSPGGNIRAADMIAELIKAPDIDGNRGRLIAVVTGMAASAAADLVAQSEYAIVYPHAFILYHGTRRSIPEGVTSEDAQSLAVSLKQTNEAFAMRLAKRSIERQMLAIVGLGEPFNHYRTNGSEAFDNLIGTWRARLEGDGALGKR